MSEAFPRADLLIIDGRNALWRSADAFSDLSIQCEDGTQEPTGAIYGFLMIMVRAFRQFGCSRVVVAWDDWKRGPVARRNLYDKYKHRHEGPPDIARQTMFEVMKKQQDTLMSDVLPVIGVRQAYAPEWEADDVIATIVGKLNATIGILSGDRDLLQLVSERCFLVRPSGGGKSKIETPDTVKAEYGLTPSQILDMKALAGDRGDNIPGIPSVGEKTAAGWVAQHGTWQAVVEWASKLGESKFNSAKVRALREHIALVPVSAQLATLNASVPLTWIDPLPERTRKNILELIQRFKFKSLLLEGRLDTLHEMDA